MFERAYGALVQMSLPSMTAMTGCLAPCSYKEYKIAGEPILMVRFALH